MIDIVDILRLGVERVIVYIFVVNAVFFTTSYSDFLKGSVTDDQNYVGAFLVLTISSHCFIGAARLRYFAVVSIFCSLLSSLRSIIWLENKGSPWILK